MLSDLEDALWHKKGVLPLFSLRIVSSATQFRLDGDVLAPSCFVSSSILIEEFFNSLVRFDCGAGLPTSGLLRKLSPKFAASAHSFPLERG
jgi:hypothetical protein